MMKIKNSVKLLGLVCLILLSGCQHIYEPKNLKGRTVETPAYRQAQLAKVKFWRADGVFSIQQTGHKSEIANFTWDEANQKNYRISIISALGLYQVQIYYQFHSVQLWKNGSHVYNAKTPEKLMQKVLGWSLPISEVRYWLKGSPAKNAGPYVVRYDAYGHISSLVQKGWMVNFSDYRTNVNGIDIARKITLQRPGFFVSIAITRFFWVMEPYGLPDVKG